MITVEKFIVKLQTHLKQPKFQLNVKVPEKSIDTSHHGKTKILRNALYVMNKNVKKDVLYVWLIYTFKVEKTLREYSELHIKNNNVKHIDGANRILFVLNRKLLLAADVAYHSSCYKAFRYTGWKKTNFTKLVMKSKN